MARTNTYELARAHIAAHDLAHGSPPTVAELTAWFRAEQQSNPSQTTLAKALREYRAATASLDPNDAAAMSLAKTIQAQADAIAEAKLVQRRKQIEDDAKQRITDAENNARVEIERAALNQKDAEARELATRGALEQARKAIEDAHARTATITNELLSATQSNATLVAQLATAERRDAENTHRFEQRIVELTQAIVTLQNELEREREAGAQREQRSAEQFSESSKVWGQQIATAREKITSLEKSLLAARVEKDDEVKQARRDISEAIAAQLKELAVSVGGMNQVHNVHMGGIRTELEATITRLDQIAALLVATPPTAQARAVLPWRETKKARE